MNKKNIISASLFLVFSFTIFFFLVAGDFESWRYSRNMHCDKLGEGRTLEICKSIEKWSEYSYYGHAMYSFGYRATPETARRVWCEVGITFADKPLLGKMAYDLNLDPRMQTGTSFLLSLLEGIENPTPDPARQDIFTPGAPGYVLEKGC